MNTAIKGIESGATRPGFNASLNGYRGLCTLLVFVYHLGSAGVIPWPGGTPTRELLAFLWSSLRYGVEMFFMISGFVILGSLLRHKTIGGFFKDRFIRIFSAWVPALLAVTAVCIALDMKTFAGVGMLEATGIFIANLLLLPPLVPIPMVHFGSWSLSYEWLFYLAAGAGMALSQRSLAPTWRGVVWSALVALVIVLYPRTLYFLTGVIVFRHQDWFLRHRQWLRLPAVSLVIFLVAWRLTRADPAQLSDTMYHWLRDGRLLPAAVAFLASLHLFACITLDTSRTFGFLKGRTFQYLGTISYSFYLWHSLVMSAVKRVVNVLVMPVAGDAVAFVVFAVTSGVIAVAVSWLSWQWFETALGRLARKAFKPTLELRSAHAA